MKPSLKHARRIILALSLTLTFFATMLSASLPPVFAAPTLALTDDFVITVKTDITGTSSDTQFTIPTTGVGYNYNVDCDNDGSNDAIALAGDYTCNYASAGTYTIRIKDNSGAGSGFPRIYFNNGGDKDKLVTIEQWGTGKWTSMDSAFRGCSNLAGQAADAPDLLNVTNMSGMFWDASAFDQNIGSWDVGAVANAASMFVGATLSTTNYDALLNGWHAQTLQNGVSFSGGNSTYCAGEAARANMTNLDSWTISDGGKDCPPTVASVTRADTNPTNAASVDFTVTFSEDVTGVDATDFTLTTTGLPGAAVSAVSGSGDTYNVTVSTGSGNGTIQAAIDAASPGDTILVPSGFYQENIIINKSITLSAEIYDQADPANNTTIIDGGGLDKVIRIAPDISPMPVIRGFVIQNARDGIIQFSDAVIEYNFITNCRDMIDVRKGGGGIIRNNIFFDASDDAIDLDDITTPVLIENNRIYDCYGDCIEIRLQGTYAPSSPIEITIRNNEIVGARRDGIQLVDYPEDPQDTNRIFIIHDNLFAHNMVGIGFMGDGNSTEDLSGADIVEQVWVYNNTFYNNDYALSGGDNHVAFNNIFTVGDVGTSRVAGLPGDDSIVAHNLFYNLIANSVESTLGVGNIFDQNPLFEYLPNAGPDGLWDTLDDDYDGLVLQSGSHAIDAGITQYQVVSGRTRPQPPISYSGTAPDLGWKESGGTPPEPTATRNTTDALLPTATIIPGPSPTPTSLQTSTPTLAGSQLFVLDQYSTIRLDVIDNDTIEDLAGNQFDTPYSSGEVYTVDKTAPAVDSTNRADPNPTYATNVDFTVTFSEAVIEVDTADFTLTTTGGSGAAVSAVSGSGDIYTVTVNTGSGDGTIRLDVPVSAAITDLVGNPLEDLPYTAGEAYTIPPSPTPGTPSGDITDTTPKYTWSKVESATNYQIQLKQGTTIVYNKYAASGACGTSTCSKTPATILDHDDYQWRARAKIDGVWGDWSAYKTFTVKPVPTPKTPSGDITDTTPKYVWMVVTGATNYQIQLRVGTTLIYNKYTTSGVCGTSTCSKTPATILSYDDYKWRARAKVGGIWGAWSAYKTFTVKPVPRPRTPSGDITDKTPRYVWTKVSGATKYQIQLRKGTTLIYNKYISSGACGTSTCSRTPATVLGFFTYKWRVRAKASGVWGPWSSYKTFTVKP